MSPSSNDLRTKCAIFLALIFCITFLLCVFTVNTLIKNLSEISSLLRPCDTAEIISLSRRVMLEMAEYITKGFDVNHIISNKYFGCSFL